MEITAKIDKRLHLLVNFHISYAQYFILDSSKIIANIKNRVHIYLLVRRVYFVWKSEPFVVLLSFM